MGVDTKMILFGAPSPQEIAAAVKSSFGLEARVDTTSVEDMFYATFPEPAGGEKRRQLAVFPDYTSNDNKEIFSGKQTHCMLGAWGSSVVIADALASRYGGYVLETDTNEDWRLVEATADSENAAELDPEDVLKIELAKIVGHKEGAAFARIADDADKLDRIMEVYAEYKIRSETHNRPAQTP